MMAAVMMVMTKDLSLDPKLGEQWELSRFQLRGCRYLLFYFFIYFSKFSIPLCLLLDPRQQLFPQAATGPLLAVELVWHFCESFLQTGKAKEAPALLRSIPATRPGLPANQTHTFENIFHFAKGPFGEYFVDGL